MLALCPPSTAPSVAAGTTFLANKGEKDTRFLICSGLKKAELEALDAEIGARGRVLRDEWAKQAKKLAS